MRNGTRMRREVIERRHRRRHRRLVGGGGALGRASRLGSGGWPQRDEPQAGRRKVEPIAATGEPARLVVAKLDSLDEADGGQLAHRPSHGVLRSPQRRRHRPDTLDCDHLGGDDLSAQGELFEHHPRQRLDSGPTIGSQNDEDQPVGTRRGGHGVAAQEASPAMIASNITRGARKLLPTRMTGKPSPVSS